MENVLQRLLDFYMTLAAEGTSLWNTRRTLPALPLQILIFFVPSSLAIIFSEYNYART